MTVSCPQCGTPLGADAPSGLCPQCLLQQGLGGPSSPTPSSRFIPPTVAELAPHFPQLEILGLEGRGGMGAVYRARQPGLDRVVALKILPAESSSDPAFAERFLREARALAKLSHPNIVAIFDFGQVSDVYYFVMEFVDGLDLRRLMETGIPPKEALAIVPQICDALQYAHESGIVHRDIKPENVLVDRQGKVKIADFGLAKLLGTEQANFTLTSARDVLGTLHYMAPEQLEHPTEVDHRADIYSLGVVLYEMLTGELPIGRFDPPSEKIEVDVRIDEVVLRALQKEPSRRFQTVSDLRTGVDSVGMLGAVAAAAPGFADAETRVLGGHPPSRPRPGPRGPHRGVPVAPSLCIPPVFGALLIPLFLFVGLGFMFFMLRASPSPTIAPAPVVRMTTSEGEIIEENMMSAEVESSSSHSMGRSEGLILANLMGLATLFLPLLTTILGGVGMARIRGSAGRLYGMALAVPVALFYPLIILDVLLVGAPYWIASSQDVHPAFTLLMLLFVMVLDVFIVVATYRLASRPPEGGLAVA